MQLRQNFEDFRSRGAVILAIGPDSPESFRDYWAREHLPFVGLSDSPHVVADAYGQQFKLFKLGRMPALVIVDRDGLIRCRQYGESMSDIPAIDDILELLDRLAIERGLNAEKSST